MIERRGWKEFQEAGLLWWVNRVLHLFGWAIVLEQNDDTGEILDAYPARCRFRGFGEVQESQGFARLTRYLERELPRISEDLNA